MQSSANSYKSTLISNEAATRAVLIDPVLRALGWDTANTYMVEVEKTLNQTRADYALYENGGSVKIIIEAKKLNDSMNQHDIKLVQYAFTFKLASIFLTDGLTWLHYTSFEPTGFAPTKVIDISQDDLGETAAYFVQHLDAALLWPEEQTVDTLALQVEQLQSDLSTLKQEMLLLKPTSITKSSIAQKPTALPLLPAQNKSLNWVPLETVHPGAGLKPKCLRLPDGRELDITTWKQILVEACKYALANNSSLPIPLADRSGKKVKLLNLMPLPDNLSQLPLPYNGQTVHLYTNYDANNCIANALYILKQVPSTQHSITPAVLF